MMNDKELHAYCWANVKALDSEKVTTAVNLLRRHLTWSVITELQERISEKREGWLHGRDNAECWMCKGTGNIDFSRSTEPAVERCAVCGGAGVGPEMSLHLGFGMSIRNLLRKHNCGEEFFGIDNLDDYYMPLLELAAGFDAP